MRLSSVQDLIVAFARSFSWLARLYSVFIMIGLIALSIALGVWAYQQPLTYHLSIGGADAPYVRNVNSRSIPIGTARWLRGESNISIAGISASHPLTLSVHLSGQGRADISKGQVVSFTLSVNGKDYPRQQLRSDYQWFTWRIDKDVIQQGKLDIRFKVPAIFNGLLTAPLGMMADQLNIEPATDGTELLSYVELDWRNILYLTIIVLLVYSFFAAADSRILSLVGLIVSVSVGFGLGNLLKYNRPLFVVYASSLCLALLIIRFSWPYISRSAARSGLLGWLFIMALSTGLLLALPDFQAGDDVFKYLTTESILMRSTLQLPPPQTDANTTSGVYSRYALGHSFALIPLVGAGLLFERILGAPQTIRYFFALLFNPIISAVTVALLFLCVRRLFGSEKLAAILSLIYFFATFALSYAVASWTEPLLGMLMLLTFYAMMRFFAPDTHNRARWLLLAGVSLGYMTMTKEEYVLPAALFGLWWLVRRTVMVRQEQRSWASVFGRLIAEGLLLAIPVFSLYSIQLAYNYIRTGSIFSSGYQNILGFDKSVLGGWYGLLLSSGKGLLLFAPPVLLCAWAIKDFWLRYRWEAVLIAGLFIQAMWFYGTYIYWEGGVSWGPRFLMPYLGLLIIFSGAALQSWVRWQTWQRWSYLLLVGVGAWLAILGALTSAGEDWNYGYNYVGELNWYTNVVFSPFASPAGHAWRLLERGYIQSQSMFQLSYYNFPSVFDHIVPGMLIGLAGIAALSVLHCLKITSPTETIA
jgi:Dolichyl-phosphate-mannose-protein mannosyltransferase